MNWRNTRFGPASWALALALSLWVLIPASSVLAYDNVESEAGEFYIGDEDLIDPRADYYTGDPGSGPLEADPDTFQIDSRAGVTMVETGDARSGLPESGRLLTMIFTWLLVVFSGGLHRNWLG